MDKRRGDDRIDLEDPLGIAQSPVPHDDRIRASNDAESVRRRRKRAGIGPEMEDRSTGIDELDMDPSAATSIDMGGGGQGNDVNFKR